MLTRLKVTGFKNLVDVDVRFGPFTCIAGANGTGKSNLFDAIQFLSALADDNMFIEAAQYVRDENGRSSDIRGIFRRGLSADDRMSFEAEMIVPRTGIDDLGQPAEASITFLRYKLTLAYRENNDFNNRGPIELVEEALVHINKRSASKYLDFPHSAGKWRESVIHGRRNNNAPFISTQLENNSILLHQDGGSRGKPVGRSATGFPRTLLSTANALESPTALIARREMQSWRLLQLEPSALRQHSTFNDPTQMSTDGAYMASTLYRLAHTANDPDRVFAQVSNRLSELLDNVKSVWVERDETKEVYTLYLTQTDGTTHPARDLSDGTLRFLALAILEMDPTASGLICLEEPENGIDPRRLPNMLELLKDISVDTQDAVDDSNPMRQVIVNTHSPQVVQQVVDDEILVAEVRETLNEGQRIQGVQFGVLPHETDPNTGKIRRQNWRIKSDAPFTVSKGRLIAYLNPVRPSNAVNGHGEPDRRLIDRKDMQELLQMTLPFGDE